MTLKDAYQVYNNMDDYGDLELTAATKKIDASLPELIRLAELVDWLNPDCLSLGAGTMAELKSIAEKAL